MERVKHSAVTLGVILLTVALTACARPQLAAKEGGSAPSAGVYDGVISFYTGTLNHLEGVRRGSCPMYPSCSQYSRQAVARNGFVKGWVMTMDRLMRCGRNELDIAPRVFVNGAWRHYDPVEKNEWPARDRATLTSESILLPPNNSSANP